MKADNEIYTVISFEIKDEESLKHYTKNVSKTVDQYGGKTIAVQHGVDMLVGQSHSDVQVIQKWPSKQSLIKWLESPEYAPLKAIRDRSAMKNLTISVVKSI